MYRTRFLFALLPLGVGLVAACGNTGIVISADDAGGSSGTLPGVPVDCAHGPNFTGCECQNGETRACYTGPAETRGTGGCKDGTATCNPSSAGEFPTFSFGPCVGEVLPSATNTCRPPPPPDASNVDAPDEASGDSATEPDTGGGAVCGGFPGTLCPSGQYCDGYPSFDICGSSDATGTCRPKPQYCTTDCAAPVCGCDNKTYCNACDANATGVAVRHTGSC